jgi:N-methylhydantoinase A
VIPPEPGLCSAFGCAITEARIDRAQTCYARSDHVDRQELAGRERRLRAQALTDLRRSVDVDDPLLRRSADMRYAGQNYELEVPLPEADLEDAGWDELLGAFEAAHERQYGFALPGEPIELITLRVTALCSEAHPRLRVAASQATPQPVALREVWFDPAQPLECAIYRRSLLSEGAELRGPAVVEEDDSTTLLHPGDLARVEASGTLLLTLKGPA